MSNDKTTEQPPPADVLRMFRDLADKNNFYKSRGQRHGFDTGYIMGSSHEYLRHLHSLLPSPVGEAGLEWVDVEDDLPTDQNQEYNLRYRSHDGWEPLTGFFDYDAKEFYVIEHSTNMTYLSLSEFPGLQWLRESISPNPSRAGEISPVEAERDEYRRALEKIEKNNLSSNPAPMEIARTVLYKYPAIRPTPAPEVKEAAWQCKDKMEGINRIGCSEQCDDCKRLWQPLFPAPERPAHLPYTNVGEIPEEIQKWIKKKADERTEEFKTWQGVRAEDTDAYAYRHGCRKLGEDMYYKMKEDIEIAGRLYLSACTEVATLTSERDTANEREEAAKRLMADQYEKTKVLAAENESLMASVESWEGKYHRAENDLQKLIDDLAAKEDEAGEYRKAVELLNADPLNYEVQRMAEKTLAKYPLTNTKPTI